MGRSGGGVNTKVEAANAKKADAQAKKDAVKAAASERETQKQWSVGADNRGAARDDAAAAKQADKMRQNAEKQALLAEEDAASSGVPKPKKKGKKKDDVSDLLMAGLAGGGKKKKAAAAPKASAGAEREKQYALRAAQEAAAAKVAAAKGVVMRDDHALMRANTNALDDDDAGATGIDNALGLLGVRDDAVESKNIRVLYNAFLDKTMPQIRADNPGLKMSQYKERVQKLWDKSPENPRNQEPSR